MLFNSFDFLVFFLVVLLGVCALPQRARNGWLLAASIFFYACWDWRLLGLMFVTIATDFVASRYMDARPSLRWRKSLLAVSVVVNLSILAVFKYYNFFLGSFASFTAAPQTFLSNWHLDIILPVGVSFYTFQSMSYTIDVYRGDISPLPRFRDFALYVTLFPQLVAGPIERATHLVPQILRPAPLSWERVEDGTWLIVAGLFKKVVLADNLAVVVDEVFAMTAPSGGMVLVGLYAFAFQIYGDFSGYTDMARGTARILGYDLMLNFRLPYFAADPSEFWRRWHISLSTWLRDYLYVPLGGNRHGLLLTCRNLMITMTLGGLWHGASWTFVLWGVYHGLLLVGHRLLVAWRGPRHPTSPSRRIAQRLAMFHLICLGWLLFRAESLEQVTLMMQALQSGWAVTEELARMTWIVTFLCGPLLLFQIAQEWTKDLSLARHLSLVPRASLYTTTVAAILMLGNFGGREFIYFQF